MSDVKHRPLTQNINHDDLIVIQKANAGLGEEYRAKVIDILSGGRKTQRNVASNCGINSTKYPAYVEGVSKTWHFAFDAIVDPVLVFQNWTVNSISFVEEGVGETLTTASIEYPIGGPRYQITVNGNSLFTLSNFTNTKSDPIIGLKIPIFDKFLIRIKQNNPSGLVLTRNCGALSGGSFGAAGSKTDTTMFGDFTPTDSNAIATPAVLSYSDIPSVIEFGDSLCYGSGETFGYTGDQIGLYGVLSRTIGRSFASCNAGVVGDKIQTFLSSNSKRVEIAQYYTSVASNYGVNDINASRTAAQVIADYETMAALFSDKQFFQSTITSATNAGNTALLSATKDAQRVLLNNGLRRSYIKGVAGVLDYEILVTDQNTGLWLNSGDIGDGLHMSAAGYKRVADNNKYPLWLIR